MTRFVSRNRTPVLMMDLDMITSVLQDIPDSTSIEDVPMWVSKTMEDLEAPPTIQRLAVTLATIVTKNRK